MNISISHSELNFSDLKDRKNWYCLRSQPKHEHIAAAHLRKLEEVEVFCPRIRYKKITRLGPAWVTEALFPNYLFAKFDLEPHQVQIRYVQGVSTIIKFGGNPAVVPAAAIDLLKEGVGEDGLRVMDAEFQSGDKVKIGAGAFSGIGAVITEVMPAKERVRVLLDFLGRPTEVVLSYTEVVRDGKRPMPL